LNPQTSPLATPLEDMISLCLYCTNKIWQAYRANVLQYRNARSIHEYISLYNLPRILTRTFCCSSVRAKLHYTDTGYEHHQRTPPTDKNLPHLNILTCRDVAWTLALRCDKFVVELLWACPLVASVAGVRVVEFGSKEVSSMRGTFLSTTLTSFYDYDVSRFLFVKRLLSDIDRFNYTSYSEMKALKWTSSDDVVCQYSTT